MTIVSKENMRAAVKRAMGLGSSHDQAVTEVAALLSLPEADVREACECDPVRLQETESQS